ncbi:MAG: hypothetical protein A2Z14_15590 [Chloroflexi bacterium RBG_16_48_8]|nr:MAG: hypothetical protein A2Z14_15590 [Chloroflexi bacterium RBG_16_48_8]
MVEKIGSLYHNDNSLADRAPPPDLKATAPTPSLLLYALTDRAPERPAISDRSSNTHRAGMETCPTVDFMIHSEFFDVVRDSILARLCSDSHQPGMETCPTVDDMIQSAAALSF